MYGEVHGLVSVWRRGDGKYCVDVLFQVYVLLLINKDRWPFGGTVETARTTSIKLSYA